MNVTQIKGITWGLAVCLTGGLGWLVYTSYFGGRGQSAQLWDPERAREVLDKEYTSEGPKMDVVALSDVRRTFQQLNWTGKEAEVAPPPETRPQEAEVVPRTPVTDLIQVLIVVEDGDRPERSEAYIRYRDTAKVAGGSQRPGVFIRPGDRLEAPHTYARVDSIKAKEGVTFVFDDEARAAETVSPPLLEYESFISHVAREDVILPKFTQPRSFEGQRPDHGRQTTLVGKNRYALGTEDMFLLADDYATVIAREVRHRRHRDPKTGKFDGIELQEVSPGGTFSRHGAQSGDIIKSINGQAVSSVSEAITFVKNNKDRYSTWEVVVENRGQERTVVYTTPPSYKQ